MSGKKLTLRMAVPEDAPGMLAIYAPCVENTSITFETEVPSEEEFRGRIERVTVQYPWLVCESERRIVGYAYASKHRERAAYQWSADLSVYVAPDRHRVGIASALYGGVMLLLERQGYYTVFAGVTSPNPASEAFHRAMGFQRIGMYENAGFKLGEWHGVTWYQKALREYSGPPAPTLSIREIPIGDVISRQEKLLNPAQ